MAAVGLWNDRRAAFRLVVALTFGFQMDSGSLNLDFQAE